MSDERTWAIIGGVCALAIAGAWAWFSTARQIDRALERAFKR